MLDCSIIQIRSSILTETNQNRLGKKNLRSSSRKVKVRGIDSLVLGPAGWFQRAWSFEVAIDIRFFPKDAQTPPTNRRRFLSLPRFSFPPVSLSLELKIRQKGCDWKRCRLYIKRALEVILVIFVFLFLSVDFFLYRSRPIDFSDITNRKCERKEEDLYTDEEDCSSLTITILSTAFLFFFLPIWTLLIRFISFSSRDMARSFILWLHGLGDSGPANEHVKMVFKSPELSNTRWLFPSAPPNPVTCNSTISPAFLFRKWILICNHVSVYWCCGFLCFIEGNWVLIPHFGFSMTFASLYTHNWLIKM